MRAGQTFPAGAPASCPPPAVSQSLCCCWHFACLSSDAGQIGNICQNISQLSGIIYFFLYTRRARGKGMRRAGRAEARLLASKWY